MTKIILLIAILSYSLAFAGTRADYHILEGKFHKGGIASVEVTDNSAGKFIVQMNYKLYKKILVPVPDDALKGETNVALPTEFRDERGYLELEARGQMEVEDATLKFVRRLKWNGQSDAFQILVLPKSGKAEIQVTYHPSLPAAGWAEMVVTFLSSNPIMNGYKIFIELNN